MTSVVGKFSHIKSYDGNDVIHIGNRNSLSISHIGDACVLTNERKLDLKDVLVVPNLKKKKLLSIGNFTMDNLCTFEFISFGIVVKDQN